MFFQFRIPKTKETNFSKCFKTEKDTMTKLRSMNKIRSDLTRTDKMQAGELIESIGLYLPYLNSLINNCSKSLPKKKIKKYPAMHWTSSIHHKNGYFTFWAREENLLSGLLLERIFTLCVLGFTYLNRIHYLANECEDYSTIEQTVHTNAQAAYQIFLLVSAELETVTWKPTTYPHEMSKNYISAVLDYCHLVSQEIYIYSPSNTSTEVNNRPHIAKIAVGCKELYRSAIKHLETKRTEKEDINPNFLHFLATKEKIVQAYSLRLLAVEQYKNSAIGAAIGILIEGDKHLNDLQPPLYGDYGKAMKVYIPQVKTDFEKLLKSWENENETIYFEKITAYYPDKNPLEAIKIHVPIEYPLPEALDFKL
ncbi:bro1 domain-containing protein brox [Anaeramoeba flamelloides]|uniref:Bro1 domain-containing protein brox n=1 Tax=Anaeramoeba flamelloides TaxID=1746091 RepID=A0AAV7YMB8_9EUKA|nr:bro1 domain-containing protein brox [Anaeramoeba flamelloides]